MEDALVLDFRINKNMQLPSPVLKSLQKELFFFMKKPIPLRQTELEKLSREKKKSLIKKKSFFFLLTIAENMNTRDLKTTWVNLQEAGKEKTRESTTTI